MNEPGDSASFPSSPLIAHKLPYLLSSLHFVPCVTGFFLWTPGASKIFLIVKDTGNVLRLSWQNQINKQTYIHKYINTYVCTHTHRDNHFMKIGISKAGLFWLVGTYNRFSHSGPRKEYNSLSSIIPLEELDLYLKKKKKHFLHSYSKAIFENQKSLKYQTNIKRQ